MSYGQLVKASLPQNWTHAFQQLCEALASTTEEEEGVRVVALTSNIAVGKSATIIGRIWDLAKVGKAPPKLVYVVSTDTEATGLLEYLVAAGQFTQDEVEHYLDLEGRPVVIRSVRQYLKQFDEISQYKDCTVVVDVNWYPRVEDEIAFSRLLSWAAKAKKETEKGEGGFRVCCVLFMSGYESQRTSAAFDRLIGNVLRLNCVGPRFGHPEVFLEPMQDGWKDQLRFILEDTLQSGRRVIIGTERFREFKGLADPPFQGNISELTFAAREDEETVAKHYEYLKKSPLLAIDAETPFSTAVKSLGLFVSPGVARRNILVPQIMQVVLKDRDFRWYEVIRHYSWVTKSWESFDASGSSNAKFLYPARKKGDLEVRDGVVENLGLAWNADFMLTVLALFRTWPSCPLDHMPMLRPVNDYVFTEAVNRLFVLGCIKDSAAVDGTYECTALGTTIMENFSAETNSYGFHLEYLMARAQLRDGASSRVQRLIARLAAVAHHGPRKLFSVAKHNADTSIYQAYLPAVVQGRAHAGALWVGAGLCAAFEAEGTYDRDDIPEKSIHGCFTVSTEDVREVIYHAKKLEAALRLEPAIPQSWISQTLTEAELRSIDSDMMWAWLHRICLVASPEDPSDEEQVVDCVSMEDLRAEIKEEPIQEVYVSEYCANVSEGHGSFNAFYLSLEEEGDEIVARDLTWLPPETFQEILEKGSSWPDIVAKSF